MTFFSVFDNDYDILNAISVIYLNREWYDLDPTFSKGVVYKTEEGIPREPLYKSDIVSTRKDVIACDCRELWLEDSSIRSIVFDPPFMFRNDFTKKYGIPKSDNLDKMCNRFSYFQNFDELLTMYIDSINEFRRVLINKGILVFKCQDFTDGSGTRPFYDTHCRVIEIARSRMFSLQDIAVLVKKNKLIQIGEQGCFRKAHCYYLVFKKEPKVLTYMNTLNNWKDRLNV